MAFIRYSTEVRLRCPECGEKHVMYFEDSIFCTACGWSRKRAYPEPKG